MDNCRTCGAATPPCELNAYAGRCENCGIGRPLAATPRLPRALQHLDDPGLTLPSSGLVGGRRMIKKTGG